MPAKAAPPKVLDPSKVGACAAAAKAGGGYVWDEVREYRVWCHPEEGAEAPIALVLHREFIDEPEPGVFVHVARERVAEWHVGFQSRPRRDAQTRSDFFAPDAPANRLDILGGLAPRPGRNDDPAPAQAG